MGDVIKFPDKQRSDLHVDHITGKLMGRPRLRTPECDNFDERMQRIKQSLEKINSLMDELKKHRKHFDVDG